MADELPGFIPHVLRLDDVSLPPPSLRADVCADRAIAMAVNPVSGKSDSRRQRREPGVARDGSTRPSALQHIPCQ